ncbi:MAG: NUDIX domain-containing protein [Verrucomicrobia bacterium]|nr:NUDIX domain-containing protein [Verrucomicrobiota bacterium]
MICAAGGLVWRWTSQGRRLAVIRRERYGTEWTLPKGKLDPGEDWAEAALREVREETGCEARIESFAGGLTYQHDGRPKIVLFWNMKLVADHGFERSEEVADLVWLSQQQAVGLLTHADERQLVASQPD